MRQIKINTNDSVLVRVTDAGIAHLKAIGEYGSYQRMRQTSGGYTRWQIWELALIFGPALGNETEPPFERAIYVEVP